MTDVSVSQPADNEPSTAELRGRINLALSLLNHRAPMPEPLAWSLIRLALLGARVDELAAME